MTTFATEGESARRTAILIGLVLAFTFPAALGQETAPAAPARADLGPARELVRTGKMDEADRLLTELQKSFPDDPSLLLLRGEILNSTGKPADAIPLLRHAAELAPQKPRVGFNLGAALAATGDSAGSLEAFGKEIENNTDPKVQALARINRSILFQKESKLAEAAAEIEQALQLDPERRDAFGDLTDLYLDLGRPDDAAGAVERGKAAGVRSARSAYRVGVAYFKQKTYEKAVPFFESALEIQPDLAPAELALARSLDHLDRGPDAEPHLRKYLELRPDAPEAAEIRKRLKLPAPKK